MSVEPYVNIHKKNCEDPNLKRLQVFGFNVKPSFLIKLSLQSINRENKNS